MLLVPDRGIFGSPCNTSKENQTSKNPYGLFQHDTPRVPRSLWLVLGGLAVVKRNPSNEGCGRLQIREMRQVFYVVTSVLNLPYVLGAKFIIIKLRKT